MTKEVQISVISINVNGLILAIRRQRHKLHFLKIHTYDVYKNRNLKVTAEMLKIEIEQI